MLLTASHRPSVFHLMNNHQLLADYAMKRPLRFFVGFDSALKRMQERVLSESVRATYSIV